MKCRYNASANETLDVALPPNIAALPSEYETLVGAIAVNYSGKAGDLQENDKRQDITYLANKSGWDARAVALAALAEQFSQSHGAERGAGKPSTAAAGDRRGGDQARILLRALPRRLSRQRRRPLPSQSESGRGRHGSRRSSRV